MEKLSFQVMFCSFFCVFLLVSRPAMSQQGCRNHCDGESEFDYKEGGCKGPANWGYLKPEWQKCKTGMMQSPIDLLIHRLQIVPIYGDLKIDYKPSNATLKNRGHDIMVQWGGDAGYIVVNGIQYLFKHCHWHSPSEHTINGKRFALEAHLVHQSLSGNIAVIGILYQLGQPDNFLSTIEEHLKEISNINKSKVVNMIDATLLEMRSILYYRYNGSLTTPPCTQDVLWTIVNKVWTVSSNQVKLLREAIHVDSNTNARPLQPLNGRSILLQKRIPQLIVG